MDVKLAIFGAVAEDLPAQIGDQGAWLEKWGWIPSKYGSTDIDTAHQDGMLFVFNDAAILPYARPNGNIDYNQPLRTDLYGRTLPVSPRLPVAQGLLYTGESPQ